MLYSVLLQLLVCLADKSSYPVACELHPLFLVGAQATVRAREPLKVICRNVSPGLVQEVNFLAALGEASCHVRHDDCTIGQHKHASL